MSTVSAVSANTLKLALPISASVISLAYLCAKLFNNNVRTEYESEEAVPKVLLRKGDSTHDVEYNEDPDAFLLRCEQVYGPVFQIQCLNQSLTVVSGPSLAREIHLHESFSFRDAVEHMTGYRAFIHSVIKSHKDIDSMLHFRLLRDGVSTKLSSFTPEIVQRMTVMLEQQIGSSEGEEPKLVEWPLVALQNIVAATMAQIFMGSEIAENSQVLQTFINCTHDFGKIINQNTETRDTNRILKNKAQYGYLNAMHKHRQVLFEAAQPVVEQRCQQERLAAEQGVEYDRPQDMLQRMLDNVDEYGFVDLEDICGHLILLILASMHTTLEAGMNVLFYLAAFPDSLQPLHEEIEALLDEQAKDREEQRQRYREKGTTFSFEGTDLDPSVDREITEIVIKRAVKVDSFLKEMFRYRTERLASSHLARKDVMLSTGHVIRKGEKVIVNMRSVHQDKVHGENLTEFSPWRFLGKNPGAAKASKDYMTFGLGKFTCPGRFLAVHDLKIMIALIVTKYSSLVSQDKERQLGMLTSPLTYTSLTGLYVTSRNNNNKNDKTISPYSAALAYAAKEE
ncbi:cytochrome P450 [Linnemannia elongata]|nr:cytochrome P450 [Linnemannia elongata]